MTKAEQTRLTAWRLRVLQQAADDGKSPACAVGLGFLASRTTSGNGGAPSTVTAAWQMSWLSARWSGR